IFGDRARMATSCQSSGPLIHTRPRPRFQIGAARRRRITFERRRYANRTRTRDPPSGRIIIRPLSPISASLARRPRVAATEGAPDEPEGGLTERAIHFQEAQ